MRNSNYDSYERNTFIRIWGVQIRDKSKICSHLYLTTTPLNTLHCDCAIFLSFIKRIKIIFKSM